MATGAEFLSKRQPEGGDYRGKAFEAKPGAAAKADLRSGAPIIEQGKNPYLMMEKKMATLRRALREQLKGEVLDPAELENTVEFAINSVDLTALAKIEGSNEAMKSALENMATEIAKTAIENMPMAMPEDQADVAARKAEAVERARKHAA